MNTKKVVLITELIGTAFVGVIAGKGLYDPIRKSMERKKKVKKPKKEVKDISKEELKEGI